MASDQRTGAWAGVVVVLLVVLAMVAVAVLRGRHPARGPQVLVVGDSVTFMSRTQVATAFDWTDKIDVQGRPGFRTDELIPVALREIDADDPEVLVVLTGYNDLTQSVDTSAAVAQLMDVAAAIDCAVWVLLPTKGRFPAEEAQAFNQRVEALAAEHPQVHVATGWRDAVDATPSAAPDLRLISADEIHPLAAGSERLAQVMEEATSRACR